MLPGTEPPAESAPAAEEAVVASPEAAGRDLRAPADRRAPPMDDDDAPLHPIGKRRLMQLRRAIERGEYPTDRDVEGGLRTLFGGERPAGDGPARP